MTTLPRPRALQHDYLTTNELPCPQCSSYVIRIRFHEDIEHFVECLCLQCMYQFPARKKGLSTHD